MMTAAEPDVAPLDGDVGQDLEDQREEKGDEGERHRDVDQLEDVRQSRDPGIEPQAAGVQRGAHRQRDGEEKADRDDERERGEARLEEPPHSAAAR